MTQSVSLNRRRYGDVITGAERINADDERSLSSHAERSLISHAERLDDIADTLVELHHLDPQIPKKTIAKALCCCRILSQGAQNVYQPCSYCRQQAVCPICQYLAARGRARDFIDDLQEYGKDLVVFDLLFTLPLATSQDEELIQADMINAAIDKLMRYRRAQSSKSFDADSKSQIMRISASMHLHANAPGGVMKPHLHCLFFAEPELKLHQLQSNLKLWWANATFRELGRQGLCMIRRLGVLPSQSRQQWSGSRLSKSHFNFTWLENKLIYNTMQSKPNEPAVDIAHRMQLLDSLAIRRTTRFSRRIALTDDRRHLPNEFDPISLGHKKMCVTDFNHFLPRLRPVESYGEGKTRLLKSAFEFIDSYVPVQWCLA